MNEEEKKVINYLENEYKKLEEEGNILFPLYKHQAIILLNLINKLKNAINAVEKEKKQWIEENTELKAITKTYDSLKNKQENIVIADKKFFDNGYFNENLIPTSFINEMQEKLKKKLNCDNNIRIYTLRDSYLLQISVLDELIDSYLDNKFKNKRQ